MASGGCQGAAAIHSRWTLRSLAGAFLDAALVSAFLCVAAAASAVSRVLSIVGLALPCTCSRPHLPCLLSFLSRYPSRALSSLLLSLLSRFPFDEDPDRLGQGEEDLMREVGEEREARAELQRELEKERSAAASAAEEAMAMILRLQKEKSALEIEARQQRRSIDERCAFYEDEVEDLRDIVLLRDREARALQREVDAYRRLLGLRVEEEDDDEEGERGVARNVLLEGEPSFSNLVERDGGNEGVVQSGNDSVYSFRTAYLHQEVVSPKSVDHVMGGVLDRLDDEPIGKAPMVGLKLDVDGSEDDGTETVEILPLSVQSDLEIARSLEQQGGGEGDGAAGMEATEGLPSDEFQVDDCGGTDKIGYDVLGSENDANVYDVHVVDDIYISSEVKGLIGRSFSDAAMKAERLQNRASADDILGKSLNSIKGAQEKLRLAASERGQPFQLQLLEDIANQLQEIKDAAEAARNLQSASPKNSKKS